MRDKFRWGILSTGRIAGVFATGLHSLDDAELVAVGSRSQVAADKFADRFDIPRRHASYEALAEDPEVDGIYIATPHSLHKENTLLCLAAGKPVICEKPFAINAAQAAEMITLAREKKIFLMEAMWTRFLPPFVKLRELLADKVIGDVRMLQADFGFRTNVNPQGRLFNPELGGGALLDVGIYPVSLASMLFGRPSRITSMANVSELGVDEQAAIILGYAGGQMALLATAIRTSTLQETFILGTEGQIEIHRQWWTGSKMTVRVQGQEPKVIDMPIVGNGYNYEAAELQACVRAGKLESDILPLDESLSMMKTLDEIRGQWGLRYPME